MPCGTLGGLFCPGGLKRQSTLPGDRLITIPEGDLPLLPHPFRSNIANSPSRTGGRDTEDPKNAPFRDAAKRSLTVGGLGSVGEKAANALFDFVLVDMLASFCTGREDAKGAMKMAERQLQRIYR
jgi:hypothetical protein